MCTTAWILEWKRSIVIVRNKMFGFPVTWASGGEEFVKAFCFSLTLDFSNPSDELT